jgi:hypothetical protein
MIGHIVFGSHDARYMTWRINLATCNKSTSLFTSALSVRDLAQYYTRLRALAASSKTSFFFRQNVPPHALARDPPQPPIHQEGKNSCKPCQKNAASPDASIRQPVHSIPDTELVSIRRKMRRARGSRPSPPPPLQLKFQQRWAKQRFSSKSCGIRFRALLRPAPLPSHPRLSRASAPHVD